MPPSTIDCDQPALHENSSNIKSPRHIPSVASYCNWLMYRVSAPGSPPIDPLQVLLQSCLIMASKCISKLAPSRPPNSHDYSLQVHLQTRSITACKCISKLTRLWTSSASLSLLNPGLWVLSKLARLWPPSASPCLLNLGFQVHLQIRSIRASNCISEFTQSRPPRASPNLLDNSLQLHLRGHFISASKCISKPAQSQPPGGSQHSLDRHLQAHLEFLWSTAFSQSRYTVCRFGSYIDT